jgi:hypothetical protein
VSKVEGQAFKDNGNATLIILLELLGLWSPSSGILNAIEHNVSETGTVSILMWGEEETSSVLETLITGQSA